MSYKERIDAIRAREAAATGGPWIGTTDPSHFNADCVDSSEWSMYVERRCDRDFIAESRADIPFLLDRITALEAALGEAIKSIEGWAAYAPDYFKDKHDLQGDIDRLTANKEGRYHE